MCMRINGTTKKLTISVLMWNGRKLTNRKLDDSPAGIGKEENDWTNNRVNPALKVREELDSTKIGR